MLGQEESAVPAVSGSSDPFRSFTPGLWLRGAILGWMTMTMTMTMPTAAVRRGLGSCEAAQVSRL